MSSVSTLPSSSDDPAMRNVILAEVIAWMSQQGYHYVLSKGASHLETPPRGSGLNCQAAARLAIKLAGERGVHGLKLLYYSCTYGHADGFIVLGTPGLLALGTDQPTIRGGSVKCWEFENHYRVQDPLGFNKVYDPIFGSSGNLNPKGILASTKTIVTKGNIMESVYGNRYKVVRGGGKESCEEVSKLPVAATYMVDDTKFRESV